MTTTRRFIIGRDPEGDVIITQPGVSWRHCALTQTGNAFVLEDLQSGNGTFVNGVRITVPTPVRPEDKITLGANVPLPWPKMGTPVTARPPVAPGPINLSPPAVDRIVRIGRDPDNDVVLDFAMVSQHHARILVSGAQLILEDLGSSNGTAIGAAGLKIQQAPLRQNDVVFFGSLRVPVSRLLSKKTGLGQKPHHLLVLDQETTLFGRDPNCDYVLSDPLISWQHARLSRSPQGIVLKDLGSSNGTYVNGQRIRGKMSVKAGDVIGIGSYTFTLTAAGTFQQRDFRGNITLEARAIAVAVRSRRLLDAVSLTIYPSEFVGLMGPSGAGKTTLMNTLNGYTTPSAGNVLLNGQDLSEHYRQFAAFLGYVPQDDIIHRDLTVGQALYYSARLRLPPDFSDAEIAGRIADVIKQLGLQGTENTLIGSPEKRGISGGQRKRVNLAMELLTDPLVLFLDEPTSGLSSEDALVVMKVLRELANQGKTILLTIHQPSLEVFQLRDNLVLVAKDANSRAAGCLVYYGPAYPDAIEFFDAGLAQSTNRAVPDNIFKGLGKQPAEEWHKKYQASTFRQEYIVKRANQMEASQFSSPRQRPSVSFFYQWRILVSRCLAIKIKDTVNTAILLAQAPVVGLLIVLVFGKQVSATVTDQNWPDVAGGLGVALFMLTLSALWFGASNAVREIVGEWAIYVRERMVNLSIPAYVASKLTILGGLAVVQCLILLAIAGWGCHLNGSLGLLFCFMLMVAMIGSVIGLLLSAVARTSEMAISLLPIVLMGMVVLGGSMQPIHQMHEMTQPICNLNPARWAYEGMMLTESAQQPTFKPTAQDMAERFFPKEKHRSSVATAMFVLLFLFSGLAGMILLVLKIRDVRK